MVSYVFKPAYHPARKVLGMTPSVLRAYTPTLTFWGLATVFAAATFTEAWPLMEDTFYSKIPILGKHWQKEVDPQDVPI